MTRPRGYRTAELPQEPAKLLRTLRVCRGTMIDVSREVRVGGMLYEAVHGVVAAIDGVAKVLTGSDTYFHIGSSTATEAEKAHKEKLRRIEAGEEPWPL